MITIYGDKISGNCLKVKYVADQMGVAYEWIDISVLDGAARAEAFLELNPAGQVPVVAFGDGKALAQSNAIMRYLAGGGTLIPDCKWDQAKMDEWLFWEQYSHEPAIAVVRFQVVYKGRPIEARDPALVLKGEAALDRMEAHLAGRDWFVGKALSLADIALYAYTQFAEDAGFSLGERPNIYSWLKRASAELV